MLQVRTNNGGNYNMTPPVVVNTQQLYQKYNLLRKYNNPLPGRTPKLEPAIFLTRQCALLHRNPQKNMQARAEAGRGPIVCVPCQWQPLRKVGPENKSLALSAPDNERHDAKATPICRQGGPDGNRTSARKGWGMLSTQAERLPALGVMGKRGLVNLQTGEIKCKH